MVICHSKYSKLKMPILVILLISATLSHWITSTSRSLSPKPCLPKTGNSISAAHGQILLSFLQSHFSCSCQPNSSLTAAVMKMFSNTCTHTNLPQGFKLPLFDAQKFTVLSADNRGMSRSVIQNWLPKCCPHSQSTDRYSILQKKKTKKEYIKKSGRQTEGEGPW